MRELIVTKDKVSLSHKDKVIQVYLTQGNLLSLIIRQVFFLEALP